MAIAATPPLSDPALKTQVSPIEFKPQIAASSRRCRVSFAANGRGALFEPYSPFRGREVPTDRIMVAKTSLEIGSDDYRGDKWACSAAINTSKAYHGLGM